MGDSVGNLNNVITELEEETKGIKSFSRVLKKIEQISKNIEHIEGKVIKNAHSQISATEALNKSTDLLESKLNELKIMIKENIQTIYKDNQNYQREIDDSLRIRLEKYNIDVENKIEGLSKQSQGLNKNVLDMNKKLTLVLEAYENDRNRGFWARLFNK
jgi:methyl-accepting chemotaxis protein